MINSRRKGHNYERFLAKWFKNLGFYYTKTSRAASKLLDDCGVDLAFLPFLIQAKRGYNKNRPKFENIYKNIKTKLAENYPEDDPIHKKPIILAHKLDGKTKEFHQITLCFEDIELIISKLHGVKTIKLKSILSDLMSQISTYLELVEDLETQKFYTDSYNELVELKKQLDI